MSERVGQDSPEGEADDLAEAECHAAGVGPLGLLLAEGRARLAEAFLASPGI